MEILGDCNSIVSIPILLRFRVMLDLMYILYCLSVSRKYAKRNLPYIVLTSVLHYKPMEAFSSYETI